MTWGDKIRSMSDEELAEWIVGIVSCVSCERKNKWNQECGCSSCKDLWLRWLGQEESA